jgi:TRAP-type C4-dicarboxylate transport system permease large subunit
MLDLLLHLFAGGLILGLMAFLCFAAVAMNVAEHRAHRDVRERQRARSQEALARHELTYIEPADRRIDDKCYRRAS